MKKWFLMGVLLFALTQTNAQKLSLSFYNTGVFDDRVDSYYDNTSYYNGKIKGGYQWGFGAEVRAQKNLGVELMYLRQDTKAPLNYYSSGVKFTNFDLAINHYLVAVNRYLQQPGSKAEFYGSGMIGIDDMKLFNPDNGKRTNATKLALGIRGGVNFWATEKVGIKLQAQLLQAVQSVGGGFFFGTGGSGAGLATYSSILQFGLGGGLTFRLGDKGKGK
jgi:hypothetical protein